ncbi:MAG: hypothetical protein MK221_03995 [Gemmatimonadetes bacterium]|nr:hypothetical protein [Gemmatimonadota bacterium]
MEIAISSWKSLAILRFLTLSMVLLLIWDPNIPVARTEIGQDTVWVLLDGSQSMRPTDQSRPGLLEEVMERLTEMEEMPLRIMLFGERPRFVSADSVESIDFRDELSTLGPALVSAAEAGASDVLVLSDFRINDVETLDSYSQTYGLDVKFERLDMERRNVGVEDFMVFRNDPLEETVTAQASIFSEGLQEDESITIEIFEEENLVVSEEVNPISIGNTLMFEVELPINHEASGLLEYRISLGILEDDFSLDNQKSTFIDMSFSDKEIVFLSMKPDWEPRFLLPVLSEVSGLSFEGFLSLGDDQFLSMNDIEGDESIVTESRVKRAVAASRILIVHGLAGDSPDWVVDALDNSSSTIAFIEDGTAASKMGVSTQQSIVEGEWYLESSLKPSPLASTLSGIDLTSLAPLNAVLPMLDPNSYLRPIEFRRNGLGQIQAPLILNESDDSKQALVLASGFWRWSSRGGNSREVYRRLWSGVLGWLMASEVASNRRLVEPEVRVWSENDQSRWSAWGLANNSIHLMIYKDEKLVQDTTVIVNPESQFFINGLGLGSYSYRADDINSGDLLGSGRFKVENHSLEWFRVPRDLVDIYSDLPSSTAIGSGFSRPLHTYIIPYLLIIIFLSIEWIGRRQRGLR